MSVVTRKKQLACAETVAERVRIITEKGNACCRILVRSDIKGWICVSCAEPHNIGMGNSDLLRYHQRLKPLYKARIEAGLCRICGSPSSLECRSLCAYHRAKCNETLRRARRRKAEACFHSLAANVSVGYEGKGKGRRSVLAMVDLRDDDKEL